MSNIVIPMNRSTARKMMTPSWVSRKMSPVLWVWEGGKEGGGGGGRGREREREGGRGREREGGREREEGEGEGERQTSSC